MSEASQETRSRTIPIFIHGDEGKYLRERQLMIISFSGVLSHGQVLGFKFPILEA